MSDDIQSIDPSEILYSTPTICSELPPIEPFDGDSGSTIFPIHEDDWGQVAFLTTSQLEHIQQVMLEYKDFEVKNRREMGWQDVYVRQLEQVPLFTATQPIEALLKLLSAKEGDKPIIHTSNVINGLLTNGFTIPLGTGITLYGHVDNTQLSSLGVSIEENPNNQSLTDAFSILNNSYNLVLVDWRSQFIITGIDSSGQLIVWNP